MPIMTKGGKLLIYAGKIALEEDQCDCVCHGVEPCWEYPDTLYARITGPEGTSCNKVVEIEIPEVGSGKGCVGGVRAWSAPESFDWTDITVWNLNSIDVVCHGDGTFTVCLYTFGGETYECNYPGGVPLYIVVDEPECGAPAAYCYPGLTESGNIKVEVQDTPF